MRQNRTPWKTWSSAKKKDHQCIEHGKMNNLPQTSFDQLQQALQTSSSLDERERSLQQWRNERMKKMVNS